MRYTQKAPKKVLFLWFFGGEMMGINFKIAMILEATNKTEGGIRSAIQSANRLKDTFIRNARATSRVNPVKGWGDKIYAVSKKMEEFGRQVKTIREQADKLMSEGIKGIATGGAIAAPVIKPIQEAANLETRRTTMLVMGYSKEGIRKIEEQSLQYAKNLAFDVNQTFGIALALQRAGLNEEKTLKAQKYFTNFAQLEYYRYGADPEQTATHLAHIGESAGLFTTTKDERKRFNLNSQEKIDSFILKKIKSYTEYANAVISTTSADIATYAEALKYSMPDGRIAGLSDKHIMFLTGIFSRSGVEGSMAGTHLKDFAKGLNPYKHYMDENVAKRNARLSAMQAAGWLEGAKWIIGKNGEKRFTSAGKSVFEDADGKLKDPELIMGKIYESYLKFKAKGKLGQFKGIIYDTFGEQGKTLLDMFINDPEIIEKLKTDMKKPMSMEEAIKEYANTVQGQWDIFKGNVRSTSMQAGNIMLGDTKGWLTKVNTTLFGKNDFSDKKGNNPTVDWINKHQGLIKTGMKGTLGFAGLTAGVGVLKLVGGMLKFSVLAPLKSIFGFTGRIIKGLINWKTGFKLVREAGGGIWKSIIKGAGLAFIKPGSGLDKMLQKLKGISPIAKKIGSLFKSGGGKALGWILKLGKGIAGFTSSWLVNAARIAAGWIVAMGPVGWIILGVTAVIAAGVWAWKHNFLGFKDKCIWVWNAIKDWGKTTWTSITGFVKSAIERVTAFIERVKMALGLSAQMDGNKYMYEGKITNLKVDVPFLKPQGGNKTNNIVQNIKVNVPNSKEAANFTKFATDKYTTNGKYNLGVLF